jgi:signal transduction histidine kinase
VLESIALSPEGPTATRERGLGLIQREVLRLQHLVDRVLRFRRGELAERESPRELIDMADEVQAVVEEFAPLAAARGVRVVAVTEASPRLAAEPGAVRQLLLNLLDNAVKFGPPGQEVTVRLALDGSDAVLEVRDHGPGFAPEERDRVLEPYRRGSAATRHAVGGSGIGLTIVHDVVRRHGGAIALDAAPGGGALVVIRLPGQG